MTIAQDIIKALSGFVEATECQDRAILIGGQAILDWHAAQQHALTGAAFATPPARATTDVDLHLALEEADRDALIRAITAEWEANPDQAGQRVFSFVWRRDHSVTLDLIASADAQARSKVQFLARLGHGTEIGAARVLSPWILACHLHERCFTPAFAQLRIRRLNRLGLVGAKLTAVGVCIEELITAGRESRSPSTWTGRLAKDLQDLELLLRPRTWTDNLWEPHYEAVADRVHPAWSAAVEKVAHLRERPALMAQAEFEVIRRLVGSLPSRLGS